MFSSASTYILLGVTDLVMALHMCFEHDGILANTRMPGRRFSRQKLLVFWGPLLCSEEKIFLGIEQRAKGGAKLGEYLSATLMGHLGFVQGVDGWDVDLPTEFEANWINNIFAKLAWVSTYIIIYGVRPLLIRPKVPGKWLRTCTFDHLGMLCVLISVRIAPAFARVSYGWWLSLLRCLAMALQITQTSWCWAWSWVVMLL
jgi:hypothetical protein